VRAGLLGWLGSAAHRMRLWLHAAAILAAGLALGWSLQHRAFEAGVAAVAALVFPAWWPPSSAPSVSRRNSPRETLTSGLTAA